MSAERGSRGSGSDGGVSGGPEVVTEAAATAAVAAVDGGAGASDGAGDGGDGNGGGGDGGGGAGDCIHGHTATDVLSIVKNKPIK